jgi:hypothetical protein
LVQKDSINNANIDPWVWEQSANAMGGIDRFGNARPWSLNQRARKDIAEPGMEPNTHMFANDNVDALNAAKDHAAWVPNGSQAGWIGTQSRTRDMADPGGFEPNVLAFANPQVDVLNAEKKASWIPNGSQAGWAGLAQKDRRDIAEPGMEPNTHMFANDNVDALNAPKNHGAWVPNGS